MCVVYVAFNAQKLNLGVLGGKIKIAATPSFATFGVAVEMYVSTGLKIFMFYGQFKNDTTKTGLFIDLGSGNYDSNTRNWNMVVTTA